METDKRSAAEQLNKRLLILEADLDCKIAELNKQHEILSKWQTREATATAQLENEIKIGATKDRRIESIEKERQESVLLLNQQKEITLHQASKISELEAKLDAAARTAENMSIGYPS